MSSRKRRSSNNSKSSSKKRDFFLSVNLDGEEFGVGDHVYVLLGEQEFESYSDSEDSAEDCQICKLHDDEVMLECEQCLGGFHLKCLKPPLKSVPENAWFCSECSSSEKKQEGQKDGVHKGKKTARERFFLNDLGIARIEK